MKSPGRPSVMDKGFPLGGRSCLAVQLAWLPQNLAVKLSGRRVVVERPDSGRSEWVIATVERHCSHKLLYLEGATPKDVFPGCFVYL